MQMFAIREASLHKREIIEKSGSIIIASWIVIYRVEIGQTRWSFT